MDRTIFSFKGKLLTSLPPFWAKLLYRINHKSILFTENKYKIESFSLYIPHTMKPNYDLGHEVGVAQRIQEYYNARKDFVFWDVGSCFSYYSAMISAMNPMAKLFAFEPFVGHYMYIEQSINQQVIKNMVLTKKFVGEQCASNMISLDSFFYKTNVVPHLIKIDVDGAEMGVLDGSLQLIKQHRPDFLIELDCNRYKQTHKSLVDIVDKYFTGYKCSVLLNVHKNNAEWDQKVVEEVNISDVTGDIYLHLYQ